MSHGCPHLHPLRTSIVRVFLLVFYCMDLTPVVNRIWSMEFRFSSCGHSVRKYCLACRNHFHFAILLKFISIFILKYTIYYMILCFSLLMIRGYHHTLMKTNWPDILGDILLTSGLLICHRKKGPIDHIDKDFWKSLKLSL